MTKVEDGQVDCIVLSGSLFDLAGIMDVLERPSVSFVSVTQRFETGMSMGRLVLNVLLSFARLEREVISERTRDKIAAARREGRWVGCRRRFEHSAAGRHAQSAAPGAARCRSAVLCLPRSTGERIRGSRHEVQGAGPVAQPSSRCLESVTNLECDASGVSEIQPASRLRRFGKEVPSWIGCGNSASI